ncbi:MAG TPA: SEC-C metal-binding domain-containing protein [Bryobacteraceae bacterium]|nr:SEC-C metal-binding domain-containing protein [Bryobacteraceae bacterium]
MSPTTQLLTAAQQRAITLLCAGATATAAARAAGVHRNTIGNWMRSPAFRDAFLEIRRAQDLIWREQTQSALRTAPRPSSPKTGRNQPCPCGSGRKFKRCCMPRH